MQMFAIVVSFALTVVAVAMLVPAVRRMLGVIRSGQPALGRTDNPTGRALTMLKETFLHTRMLQWHWVGIMHWFVYAAFLLLSTAVLAAYFQLFKPDFAYPIIGHWYPFEWLMEIIGALSTVGIVFLIIYRQVHHPRSEGRRSRFYGSNFWQAYFVEALVLLEGGAILFVRAAEWRLDEEAGRAHYPFSSWIGDLLYPSSVTSLENIIFLVATFKIGLAMIWLMVIARNITMGIAWHRFTVWFNIYYKRESDGSTALGAMKPLTSEGKAVTLDDLDDLDEDSVLGVGKVEDFSWKGILDFTTCTECGRCQSQCPAWNTEKPLSPKLLITSLRDHAYAKSAGDEAHTERALIGSGTKGESGGTAGTDVLDYFYNPEDAPFVIDEDVLWNCTSCGACVQQCPVDIEHVDHIMDMRRYQVLVESNFPAELNQLFKGLENKGNPWSMSSTARMDWAKGLDFDVPVVGEDLESLDSVDWLFWVGCAGAYEDRAKKTTRAVAELLNMAGISFGVLGNGETCTGDPARRAGNEFVFQGLAMQNVETFKEFNVKKVVSTCAHCFNTLKNEYKDFGVELEVVHHTQLLNQLVRDGLLTPVKDGAGAAKRSITYHDPCFLGRHNEVYTPPRELLQVLPGAEFVEMERNSEKSFCCGAGGARMWMEENIGERINLNRTKEAVGTGADQIAVGCPFCRVMLSDGLTAQQAKGEAREEVEVLDVAQMLLASVKGEQATKAAPGSASGHMATKDEPQTGDVTVTEDTVTETSDVGPLAKASGGTSLVDPPASREPATETTEAKVADAPAAGGSLFDLDAPADPAPAAPPVADTEPEPATVEPAEVEAETPPVTSPGSTGSLFDIAAPAPTPVSAPVSAPMVEAEPEPEPAATTTVEPAPTNKTEPEVTEAPAASTEGTGASRSVSTPTTDVDIAGLGSLFDVEVPATAAAPTAASAQPAAESEPEPESEPAAAAPDEAPADEVTEPEREPEREPEPEPASGGGASAPVSDVDISSLGSLFEIEAPAVEASTPAAPADESLAPVAQDPGPEEAPEPETAPEAAVLTETADEPAEAPTGPPTGADLSQAATFAAPADAVTAAPARAEVEEPVAEPDDEPDTIEVVNAQPAPDSTPASTPVDSPGHQPRTDVDITATSSLFDL